MNTIKRLIVDASGEGRAGAFGGAGGAQSEVGYGVFTKDGKNEKMIAYISQQDIVKAFVEILKRSSILAMLSSGEHEGNSFDHLIASALKEMDYAVRFKK